MNSDNFHEYLKNPSRLHQVSYQELKSLVMQYPFSPNLRLLLLLKSLFDQHKEYDRNLSLAALYSPDRKKLRKLVQQYSRLQEMKEKNYALGDDYLELMDLSGLEEVLEKLPAQDPPAEVPVREEKQMPALENLVHADDWDKDHLFDETEELNFLEDMPEMEIEQPSDITITENETILNRGERSEDEGESSQAVVEPAAEFESIEDLFLEQIEETVHEATAVQDFNPGNFLETVGETGISDETDEKRVTEPLSADKTEQEEQISAPPLHGRDIHLEITNEPAPAEKPLPAPIPKAVFGSWNQQFHPPKSGLLNHNLKDIMLSSHKHHKQAPQPEEKDEADFIAELSIAEDHEIASETLALVLSTQGHYEKAISMYERLCLQYPEKSSFFAAKIEMLKKKIV
jgi:tetratricopeptide (TPR) repeat protein